MGEGAQRAMLCATLRRNPGPKFPKGTHKWTAEQKAFADKYIKEAIEREDNIAWYEKYIKPRLSEMGLSDALVKECMADVDGMFENEMDMLLSLPQEDKSR